MSIKINGSTPSYDNTTNEAAAKAAANLDSAQEAKQEAKTGTEIDTTDTYEKSTDKQSAVYTTNYSKMNALKADFSRQVEAFNKMVEALFSHQAGATKQATFNLMDAIDQGDLKARMESLEVDEATRLEAQAMVAEDGYWGVEATAQRIFDFAIALSGGDSSKASLLREAVEAGFGQAEAAWGDKLPDISQKTKTRINELFDEWEGKGTTEVQQDQEEA